MPLVCKIPDFKKNFEIEFNIAVVYWEKEIQERLAVELSAKMEIVCLAGRIDLLSSTEIIEIKHGPKWKHALGQILAYGKYYPNYQKVIHLFGSDEENEIIDTCASHGVLVRYE